MAPGRVWQLSPLYGWAAKPPRGLGTPCAACWDPGFGEVLRLPWGVLGCPGCLGKGPGSPPNQEPLLKQGQKMAYPPPNLVAARRGSNAQVPRVGKFVPRKRHVPGLGLFLAPSWCLARAGSCFRPAVILAEAVPAQQGCGQHSWPGRAPAQRGRAMRVGTPLPTAGLGCPAKSA